MLGDVQVDAAAAIARILAVALLSAVEALVVIKRMHMLDPDIRKDRPGRREQPHVGERVDTDENSLTVGIHDPKPLIETLDATTCMPFSSPVALIVAAGPTRDSGLFTRTSSAYVPWQALT